MIRVHIEADNVAEFKALVIALAVGAGAPIPEPATERVGGEASTALNIEDGGAGTAKRGPGRPKKDAAPAAAADVDMGNMGAAAPAPAAAAPAAPAAPAADGTTVSAEDFMTEVRKFAQDGKNGGVAKAQAILAKFVQADGKTPCARVNQVQEKDRQPVLDLIRAELAKAKK